MATETESEFCKIETEGPLFIVTINRPDVMNALHPPANRALAEAFDRFAADNALWVAIITGAGDKAFSAGNDLKYQAMGGDMSGQPKSGFGGLTSRFDLMKPIIAAVNGVAMGGGFEIALACDIIVASENATFALPEPRVGLAAYAGGMHRLPREIGLKQAMGMMLTGRRVSAEEGMRLGFVNDVAPAGQALARAKEWAAQILECGPLSVRGTKEAALRGLTEPSVEAAMKNQHTYEGMRTLFGSKDFVEGPLAFAQKRKPNWKAE
ncbi:MAG: enoyl-CoA hydratase/isomerase family protein [Hydrogenophilaceae bacterium]|nr:enoyl-CoA hydratase/isomerase family protein [Hydrogenophilaceae bacterium]